MKHLKYHFLMIVAGIIVVSSTVSTIYAENVISSSNTSTFISSTSDTKPTEEPQTTVEPTEDPLPTAEPAIQPTETPSPTIEPTTIPTEVPTQVEKEKPSLTPTPDYKQKKTEETKNIEESEEKKLSKDTEDTEEKKDAEHLVVDPSAGNVYVDEVANEKEVFQRLTTELGLNRATAAGIMGNIWHECRFNQAAIGGGGISYGLVQWTGENFVLLKNWCDSNGEDYRTVKGQIAFLKHDLETRFQSYYEYLRNIPETEEGAYDAAYYFCKNYERPLYTEQQAIIRGNTTKCTYWPRYKDTDIGKSENVDAYMDWLKACVDDDSHGYSFEDGTNNPDVNECSLIWYALYEKGYLAGEKNIPFGFENIASVLEKHGFIEQVEVEEDLSKLQYGDIIVNADCSGASAYVGNGKMYLAQQTEKNKKNGEKPGDQGKEVFLGKMMKGIERKIYRLTNNEALPDYAQKALESLPRTDFLSVNKISKVIDEKDNSYEYLTDVMKESGILSEDETLSSADLEEILTEKGFQDVSENILNGTDTLAAGDILEDIRYGTGISLGEGYVLHIKKEKSESRIVVEQMEKSCWRRILRKPEKQ